MYKLTQAHSVPKKEKFEMLLSVYPNLGDCGIVIAQTETGHNQEFYHTSSTFHYFILEGSGRFFLDDKEVHVQKGDMLSISPGVRIYYRGSMTLLLVTNPPWKAEDEVETKSVIW